MALYTYRHVPASLLFARKFNRLFAIREKLNINSEVKCLTCVKYSESLTKDGTIMSEEFISEWDRRRYIPKPGEPELPPQLSELADKSSDEVIEELNRLPFFMTKLDDTDGKGGENTNIEALKSLVYEGEPHEIAGNFKNQGNDCYKSKQYKNAIEYYNRGLEVDCKDDQINLSLILNRAACNLELKNYRRCIEDCKKALQIDSKNVKACYRSGKALYLVERYDEAREVINYGLKLDEGNTTLKQLAEEVDKKIHAIAKAKEMKEKEKQEKILKQTLLANAVKLRHIKIIKLSKPAALLEDAKLRLEDDKDFESQLIFPAMILYPSVDEFDFIAEISELTTPFEILSMLLERPKEWFEDPKHKNFNIKSLNCFMETESGGLIKVGKNVAINKALMSDSPKAPLFDNGLRLYVVPEEDVKSWISTWSKETALSKRR